MRSPLAWAVAAGSLVASASLALPAAAGDGAAVFAARCSSCHSDRVGETGLPGPNLHGLAGRRLGGDPAFAYSPAFEAATGTWDAARLDAYLADPEEAVPGSWMGIGNAVRDPRERAAVVRHLLGGG